MTSTPFNVGLGDGSRLSSRVLRPPGGGHTDIFGGEAEPPRGRRSQAAIAGQGDEPAKPTNGIQSPTQNGQEAPAQPQTVTPEPAQEPKAASPVEPKPEPAKIESPVADTPKIEPTKNDPPKMEPPKRVRVPPGGFSSGLW